MFSQGDKWSQLHDTDSGTRSPSHTAHNKPVNMADIDDDWLHEVRPVPKRKVLDEMGHARVMILLKDQRLEIQEVI
jgi:hypothetical protein